MKKYRENMKEKKRKLLKKRERNTNTTEKYNTYYNMKAERNKI